jgi:hypothetical protein
MPAASSASVDASPESFTSDETSHTVATEHTQECCPCKSGGGYGYKSKYGGGHGYGGYKKQYDGHSYGGQYGGGHQGYGGYQSQYGGAYETQGYQPQYGGGYETQGYQPQYGSGYGYEPPMYGGYEQSSYGGYETPTYGGYEAPTYGGYQSMGYAASPYGGSGYGSYSLGYGGIPTSALYGAYAKNDDAESTDIPATLTELKTDYIKEYLEKLDKYTKAQDTYKTDTLNVKVNWDLQDSKHEYLKSEHGINPQVHHPYGHGGMGYGGQNYGGYQSGGYGSYQGNTGYGYEKSSYGGYEAPTYGGYQPSYRSDATSSTTSQEES